MALDLLRALLERNDRLDRRHFAEGVRAFVKAVAPGDDLAVADGRALRAVDANVGGDLGHQPDQEVDAVDLDGYVAHGLLVLGRCSL